MYRIQLTVGYSQDEYDQHGFRYGAGAPFPTAEIVLEPVTDEVVKELQNIEGNFGLRDYVIRFPAWVDRKIFPNTISDADIEWLSVTLIEKID
jgi:hypothetical protein